MVAGENEQHQYGVYSFCVVTRVERTRQVLMLHFTSVTGGVALHFIVLAGTVIFGSKRWSSIVAELRAVLLPFRETCVSH